MKIYLPLWAALACSTVSAQTEAAAPSFEVASVRDADPSGGSRIATGPGTLTMINISLKSQILWAFDIQPVQLQCPQWLDSARFSITAKAAGSVNEDQLRLMLRSLLADRFGLKFHHEVKEVQIYALTLAKTGAKFHDAGPKDSSKFLPSKSEESGIFGGDRTGMTAQHARLSEIAEKLSEPLARPVIDRTGLAGHYDLRIDITPYLTGDTGDGGQRVDPSTIIFTALQGQFGLKVEPGRDKVDYLVIDAVNKAPSGN